jgi:hypothetical protein
VLRDEEPYEPPWTVRFPAWALHLTDIELFVTKQLSRHGQVALQWTGEGWAVEGDCYDVCLTIEPAGQATLEYAAAAAHELDDLTELFDEAIVPFDAHAQEDDRYPGTLSPSRPKEALAFRRGRNWG